MTPRAQEAAQFLLEIVQHAQTSGRPGADHELEELLKEALGRRELERLIAFANFRLDRHPDTPLRRRLIEEGLLRVR